jgi:hypothetical protein
MDDDHSADDGERERARRLRRLHRQVALGCTLACLVLLGRYPPLEELHNQIVWLQVTAAGALAADVLRTWLLHVVLPIQISINRKK